MADSALPLALAKAGSSRPARIASREFRVVTSARVEERVEEIVEERVDKRVVERVEEGDRMVCSLKAIFTSQDARDSVAPELNSLTIRVVGKPRPRAKWNKRSPESIMNIV